MNATLKRNLPGDAEPAARIARMIRVDHAGEYGAKRIYAGQLAVLGKRPAGSVIRHMAAQEEAHLAAFTGMIAARRVRPTALMPLWHVAGFALGAATALLGEKAAMACTVAVESVIDEHYAAQEAQLGEDEAPLKSAIAQFRAEEQEHHATGLAHGAEQAAAYPLLTNDVQAATKAAIWLSTRL